MRGARYTAQDAGNPARARNNSTQNRAGESVLYVAELTSRLRPTRGPDVYPLDAPQDLPGGVPYGGNTPPATTSYRGDGRAPVIRARPAWDTVAWSKFPAPAYLAARQVRGEADMADDPSDPRDVGRQLAVAQMLKRSQAAASASKVR